jgi:hypothetical protein
MIERTIGAGWDVDCPYSPLMTHKETKMNRIASIPGLAALSLAIAFAIAPTVAVAGPLSPYYVTAGDQGHNYILQGNTATLFNQANAANGGEYAIAVTDTVRTLGNGNAGQHGLGSQYTLAGVYTGVNYTYPASLSATAFYDGTSDGRSNYSVDFLTGAVYRLNADWTSPSILFNLSRSGLIGITYDTTNNSLWISAFSGNTISNYSLTGALLSTFNATQSTLSCLALDSADNTLWVGSQSTLGTFYQYSKTGVLLSTVTYAALVNQNTLGGEFSVGAVPEPSAIALLGLGGALGLGLLRRRTGRQGTTSGLPGVDLAAA